MWACVLIILSSSCILWGLLINGCDIHTCEFSVQLLQSDHAHLLQVVNERISDLTSCCGNAAYEDDSGMCCGDQVVPRGFSTDCCGQTAYNEDNEVCCHGEVIQASGNYKEILS